MKSKKVLLPSTERLVTHLGDRIRLARRRRKLTAKMVAQRAGISVMTLRNIEHGNPSVSFGAYVMVMQVLGVVDDINLLAKADELGRALQDARL